MAKTRYHFQVSKDGTVNSNGVDFGGALSVLARNREYLVIKVAAHSYWKGHFMDRGYASPETKVYKIVSESNYASYSEFTVEEAINWETKRKAKEAA